MKIWVVALSLVALSGSLVLLGYALSMPLSAFVERPSVTVVEAAPEPTLDASAMQDAGVTAELKNVRPTVEQLADKFLLFELRDLIDQAKTPEDKKLVQDAFNLRQQRGKALELSPDFETNMKRGLK